MRQIHTIQFSDEGNVSIDWVETDELRPGGGTFNQTYVTLTGREASEQVEYYVKELRQDAEELLHHTLKMLQEQPPMR